MKSKRFTHLFLFFFLLSFQLHLFSQGTFTGNTELNTQAEVAAFGANNYTKLEGFLLIKGTDITDLSPLNSLEVITRNLFIEYTRELVVLNGFSNLTSIGGLYIDSNTELDSIAAFGKLSAINGILLLRDNHVLRECCALYPIISGQQGVVLGSVFIEGNKGCKSEKDLLSKCDADSDNDNADDSEDGCPNDPLKTKKGACGCGVPETDSDKDGTPDCNDECPNDANKILKGDCGCGRKETDSDKDGVPDCKDECPYTAGVTKMGICGCTNPRIVDLQVSKIGTCKDNGTSSTLDDIFPAELTITFEGVPTSGRLLITGDANHAVSFSAKNTSRTITLSGLNFKADGELIEVIATFEGNPYCTKRRVFGTFAPENCSSGACNPPNNIIVDTENYPNGAFLIWNNLGDEVRYEIGYRSVGNSIWQIKAAKTNQVEISNLLDFTTYEYRIRSVCDGEKISDYTNSTFTTGGKECKLLRAEVQGIKCQDNQTPDDPSDDYFSFNLYVEGANVGASYSVTNVTGGNQGQYQTLNTFRTFDGTLGKGNVSITIIDNEHTACFTPTIVTDPGVCSQDCQIDYMAIDQILTCFDRGSNWVVSDDFFTADLTVYFTNAPVNGELKLTGNTSGSVSTERLQNQNSYTFKAARIPATGKDFSLGATFTNGLDCDYSANFNGVLIKDDKICWERCNIMNAQALNVQCADNNTPSNPNDDYLTFELVVTGVNIAGNYRVEGIAGNNTGAYNQPAFFRTTSGNYGQKINLKIVDENNLSCNYSFELANKCVGNGRFKAIHKGLSVEKKELSLYPNPAKSELIIEYPTSTEKVQIVVFDLLGKSVISKELQGNHLDISHLEKGIYHLVIQEGAIFQARKFVKE